MEQIIALLLERLREVDVCLADISALIRTPPASGDELQRLRESLDQQRELALDGLEDTLTRLHAHAHDLPSDRPFRVAIGLLGAMTSIRAIRLLPDARQDWNAEFYWDLYYMENRLLYAALRALDEQSERRMHM